MALAKRANEDGTLTELGQQLMAGKVVQFPGSGNADEPELRPEVIEHEDGNQAVVKNVLSFPNIETAMARIGKLLAESESKRLAAARIVLWIEREEKYRELGCESMADFYPVLLPRLASVGWGAERTVKGWMSFVRVYLEQMGIVEQQAMKANSHLFELYSLADVDRKTSELATTTEKEGKLDEDKFVALADVVVALVNAPTTEQKLAGLDRDATAALLREAGISEGDLNRYEAVVGEKPALPQNGWTVRDTKEVVKKAKGKKKEVKVRQVYYTSFMDDEKVHVESLGWESETDKTDENDKPLWVEFETLAVKKDFPRARFDAMTKGARVVDLTKGNDNGDDGFTGEEDDE